MTFWLLVALVALLALCTLLPIWRHEAWWVRGNDFPRLQYAAVALVLLAIELLALDRSDAGTWLLLAVTVACLLYQAWWIIPYTPVFPKEVQTVPEKPQNSLRIMNANVLMPNRNAAGLLRIIEAARPDVVIAVETDLWWQQKLDVLEREYPHTIKCPLENLYGMHLYSRFPLEDYTIQYLVEPDIPSMHTLLVLPTGLRVKLHCVHPKPPSPTENPGSSERDAELVALAKSVAASKDGHPVIVAGDLNDVAWSETTRLFRKISGLLDPRVGRGMYNTFHTGHWYLRWPLDHLFHSRHFAAVGLTRLPAFGSDHFPILVELAHHAHLDRQQEGLSPDSDDKEWAAENLQEQDVSGIDVHTPDRRGQESAGLNSGVKNSGMKTN